MRLEAKRGWDKLKGASGLPEPLEGKLEPQTRDGAYEVAMSLAQKNLGTLLWLALRSRPDITALTAIAASLATIHPDE